LIVSDEAFQGLKFQGLKQSLKGLNQYFPAMAVLNIRGYHGLESSVGS